MIDLGIDIQADIPPREEIQVMEDMEQLRALLAQLDVSVSRIETDLEFGDGDDHWARRARGALAYHKAARQQVARRMATLEPSPRKLAHEARVAERDASKVAEKGKEADRAQAKALARQAQADLEQAAVERRRVKALDAGRLLESQRLDLLKRSSWLRFFHQAARDMLGPSTIESLQVEADDRHQRFISAEVEKGRAG